MATDRSHTSGRFSLDINGDNAGYLKSFSGFDYTMDVIKHDLGPENFQIKNVGNLKYTPAKFQIGMGMGAEMYTWIRAAYDKDFQTKSGQFTAADFNYKAQSSIDFKEALITSVTIPKLTGDSKESGYFTIQVETEQVRHLKGNNQDIRGKLGVKQKAWTLANYRFVMGDLPTRHTSAIEAMELKCAIVEDRNGEFREYTKHPAAVTVPDVTFEISAKDKEFDAWRQKAEDWFVAGNCEAVHELQGAIEFLDPTLTKVLGSIELKNCGFAKFEMPESKANAESIKRFKVTMYCEQQVFKLDYTDPAK